MLTELQRALDEMSLSEAPSAAEGKPAYVLEQLPQLRDALAKGVSWSEVGTCPLRKWARDLKPTPIPPSLSNSPTPETS